MSKTIVVGMSGGVDSSVAALLLKQQGFDVVGLFMHNWDEQDDGGFCTAEADFNDVKSVCNKLCIPYYSVDFSKDYQERVFKYFLEEYKKGRTPNPDVLCNREIKFGPFLDYALKLGADYIATGHYCGVRERDGKHYLLKAADEGKDQSYFLNQVTERQLSHVIFPLANIKKDKVRAVARAFGLDTAGKKDSTGLCFIGERNFKEFLSKYLPAQKGDIKTPDGKTVGQHDGLMYYTIGQRRGLGLGGDKDAGEGRWFVIKKDVAENVLYVSCGDMEELYSGKLAAAGANWIPGLDEVIRLTGAQQSEQGIVFDCNAKFRYRQPEQKVRVIVKDGGLSVFFYERQKAVTGGQYVVFYINEYCLGGAEIV